MDRLGLLPRLSLTSCCRWFAEGQCKDFAPGDLLFNSGNPHGKVIVLESGIAMVTKKIEPGYEAFLRICTRGDIIGEEALLDLHRPRRPLSITAKAVCQLRGHVLSRQEMRDYLDSIQGAWALLAEDLSARLSEADSRIASLSCDPPNRRLARLLCDLVHHGGGVQEDGGRRLPISVPQTTLAMWIGASCETVERILRKWRNQQLISTAPRLIIIRNLEGLTSIARIEQSQV